MVDWKTNKDVEGLKEELGFKYVPGWSNLPSVWLPAVKWLIDKIRERYTVDGSNVLMMKDVGQQETQVKVDQIKDKFGSLRFYYSCDADVDDNWIDEMIEECEKRLARDDPTYGTPY